MYKRQDVAIITDVCHDTNTPMINKIKQGDLKCGDGPVLSYGPSVQNNLLKLIINSANKNKIPFQRLAASRVTGTDTDAFAYSNGGVASALISLPLRYMHTTVEMVHRNDVENVIKLIYETVLSIKNGESFSYFEQQERRKLQGHFQFLYVPQFFYQSLVLLCHGKHQ